MRVSEKDENKIERTELGVVWVDSYLYVHEMWAKMVWRRNQLVFFFHYFLFKRNGKTIVLLMGKCVGVSKAFTMFS